MLLGSVRFARRFKQHRCGAQALEPACRRERRHHAGSRGADAAADRTAGQIRQVQAAGARDRSNNEGLILERDTVFPGQSITFALVPDVMPTNLKAANPMVFTLKAQLGADQHVFEFVRSTPDGAAPR